MSSGASGPEPDHGPLPRGARRRVRRGRRSRVRQAAAVAAAGVAVALVATAVVVGGPALGSDDAPATLVGGGSRQAVQSSAVTTAVHQPRSDMGTRAGAHAEGEAAGDADGAAEPAPPRPSWADQVPSDTTQVLRTVPSSYWCEKVYCSQTEAWEKVDGAWRVVDLQGVPAIFRSQTGSKGFAAAGERRQGDLRTPAGVYGVATTFSTTDDRPTDMPWRQRLPTSVVSSESGRTYNTWIEVRGNSYGDRRMMSWGIWIDYNNPRMHVGDQPEPHPDLGSGIFVHTSNQGEPWVATLGCVQIGDPEQMEWVVRWLDPAGNPQVVNNL